jgi:hypothetical protein
VAVSARSNRALSQFWCTVLATLACLLIGLEFAISPAQKAPTPVKRRASVTVVTHPTAETTSNPTTAAG